MACRLVGAKPFIWTNVGTLLIGPLGTNFSEIIIWIQTFSFKKMPLKMSSAKWRPFCLGLNELTVDPFCNFAITELLYATLCYLDHDVLSVRRYHNPTIYIYYILTNSQCVRDPFHWWFSYAFKYIWFNKKSLSQPIPIPWEHYTDADFLSCSNNILNIVTSNFLQQLFNYHFGYNHRIFLLNFYQLIAA